MKLIEGDFGSIIRYCERHTKNGLFVFELSYVPAGENFRELSRFEWESRHTESARFTNRYTGSAAVNVTAWNENGINEYFMAFLYYLKDREKQLRCFMISEERFSRELLSCVGKVFPDYEIETAGKAERRKDRAVIGFSPDSASAVIGTAARAENESGLSD